MQPVNMVIAAILSVGILVSSGMGITDGKDKTEAVVRKKDEGKVKPDQFPSVFLRGEYERIYKQTSETFREQISYEQFRQIAEQFNRGVGSYSLVSVLPVGDGARYAWQDDQGGKGLVAVFGKDHTILGLQVIPLQTYPETDHTYTKTEFVLPFKGEWTVFWGGTNAMVNYHYAIPGQRYAYDFVIIKGNKSYAGDPLKNASYRAFGQEVLAPADGTVVKVENGIKDNEPVGQMNADEPAGNVVVIDHGNGEYSFLAHFQYGSIRVKPGDRVRQGDVLGYCGNSGNSSEPHIHFHVADSPDLFDSKSIRIRFKGGDAGMVQGNKVKSF